MPLRVNPQTIIGIVSDKLTNKLELSTDARVLANVVHAIVRANQTDCDATGFKRQFQEIIVAAISAANRLLDIDSVSALQASNLTPLDRFAVLHFASVQRAMLKGLENVVSNLTFETESKRVEPNVPVRNHRTIHEELRSATELAMGLDTPYTLAVNPTLQLGPYYEEQVRIFSLLIGVLRVGWHANAEFGKSIEIAMRDYSAWASGDTEAARIIRSYLNYVRQQEQINSVSEDVKGLSLALQDWLRANNALSERRKEGWRAYRETLLKLPDDKNTMFDEDFGVRKVFVQPVATYKVAGAKQVSGAQVADVAGLIGTLVSTRIDGDDLILLAGGPGSGKSTLCRVLAAELALNEDIHPIFLRLRRLQDSHDIRGYVETHLQSLGLIERISDLTSVPNLVLILDGFDELVMASRTKLREFFNALKEDLSTGPLRHAKAIVSGRDTLFPNGQGLPTGAHVISLQPFDRGRISAWGAKWRQQHTQTEARSFYPENLVPEGRRVGQRSSPLEHLVSWPLTLHLVARAHTSGSINLKPDTADDMEKAALYRSIVADTALRQDEQAGGRGRLNTKQMRMFVQAVAWEMYSTGREALDVSEGLPILRSILPEATEADLAELADVTIVNQPELTKGDETGFEFVHKSFSEYFAAETIATKIEEVCFCVPQWGGEHETWRMSGKDATSALANLFGIRLLTAEVQEMLEPMLDDFLDFIRNKPKTSSSEQSNLEKKLRRFEELISDFAAGGLLRDIAGSARSTRLNIGELEIFGNYASALLFVAVALVKRRNVFQKDNSKFVRIPPATLIRLLHIIQAGEIQIDLTYSRRGLQLIDARRQGGENTEIFFPPLAPNLLNGVLGLELPLDDAITKLSAHLQSLEIENILLNFLPNLGDSGDNSFGRLKHRRYDYRYRSPAAHPDYLQRIVSLGGRSNYDEFMYFERRLMDLFERLRTPDGGQRIEFFKEAFIRIREIARDGFHYGSSHFEILDRIERVIYGMSDTGPNPTRPPKNRQGGKKG